MIPWPKDRQPAAEDVLDHLLGAVHQLYWLEQRSDHAVYSGYEFTAEATATSAQPDEALSVEGLEYHRGRGREPIAVVLMLAFQLGYQQRICHEKQKNLLMAEVFRKSTEKGGSHETGDHHPSE